MGNMEAASNDISLALQRIEATSDGREWQPSLWYLKTQVDFLTYRSLPRVFEELVRYEGFAARAYALRANWRLRDGDSMGAIADCSRVIIRNDSSEAFLNRAVAFSMAGRLDSAENDLKAAVERIKKLPSTERGDLQQTIDINTCFLLFRNKQFQDALALVQRLIEDKVIDHELLVLRAEALSRLGYTAEAEVAFKKVTELTEAGVVAEQGAATFQFRASPLGAFSVSIQLPGSAFRHVTQTSEAGSDVVEESIQLVRNGDQGSAVALLESHLEAWPTDTDARTKRAAICLDLGDLEEAESELDILLAESQPSQQAYSLKGLTAMRLGAFRAAIDSFSVLIRHSPSDSTGYLNRGIAFFANKQWQLASEDFERALEKGETSADLFCWYGRTLSQTGQHAEASHWLGMAVREDPSSAKVLQYRAKALIAANEDAEALSDLNVAVQIEPGNTSIRLMRAKLFIQAKRYAEAMEDLALLTPESGSNAPLEVLTSRLQALVRVNASAESQR